MFASPIFFAVISIHRLLHLEAIPLTVKACVGRTAALDVLGEFPCPPSLKPLRNSCATGFLTVQLQRFLSRR